MANRVHMRKHSFIIAHAEPLFMGTSVIIPVKKDPMLNDSRFYTNNTLNGIKALERWEEKGKITP